MSENDQEQVDKISQLESNILRKKSRYYQLKKFRANFLSFMIPLLVIGLLIIAGYSWEIFYLISDGDLSFLQKKTSGVGRVLILWFFVLLIAKLFDYFFFSVRIKYAKASVSSSEEELYLYKITHAEWKVRFNYVKGELTKLTNQTSRVFFDTPERYHKAKEWLDEAFRKMEWDDKKDGEPDLNGAISLLSSIRELIYREEKEQSEQRSWRYLAISIIALYIFGLVYVGYLSFSAETTKSHANIPIFGIPLSVLVWGAAGSLAAILYRFYTEEGRISLGKEVRWLIARPFIGIIMGGVAYLAIISGLVLLGETPTPPTGAKEITTSPPNLGFYWIIAFLAGFSDKFYLKIINLLVQRTFPSKDEKKDKELKSKKKGREQSEIVDQDLSEVGEEKEKGTSFKKKG